MNNTRFKIGVFLIILVCIGYGGFVWYWWGASMESKGQLGDSFGVITSLFSVLTFFYFVYTVDLQRQQLEIQKEDFKLQLEEIKETREEFKKQSKAQQASEEALRKQIEKQVLSTLLSSYTTQYTSLLNRDVAGYSTSINLHTHQSLERELRGLKTKIDMLEKHLEKEAVLTLFSNEPTDKPNK